MKTLRDFTSCPEYNYLNEYNFVGYSWSNRHQAYRYINQFLSDVVCHVCFNPVLSCYVIVADKDYRHFKHCSAVIGQFKKILERNGYL